MLVAYAATGSAYAWARLAGADRVPLDLAQVSLLLVGLLAAGIGIWIRCAGAPAAGVNDLSPAPRRRALYALAAIHGALAVAVSVWVVLKLGSGRDLPGDLAGTILLWLLAAPWCAYSAYQLANHTGSATQLNDRLETAVLVTEAGIVSFLASWALYWGPDFIELWDSLRLFLAVAAAFAFLAAALIAASTPIRRLAVSTLILIHFAAILSAVLSAAPGPWIMAQAQVRMFGPYLDFMYLNNAYRFYAPEPGPASQLWFRIEYKKGDQILARWTKLPEMDDKGRPNYPITIQYTRRLALTENVARTFPVPWTVLNQKGEMEVAPFVKLRDAQTPDPMDKGKLVFKPVENSLEIPMHPEMQQMNYQHPTPEGMLLLSSYARCLLRQPHPNDADAKPLAVRIYRVQHRILPAEALANGADPRDWIFFLPYYMGKYDTEGRLLDPQDPFLFWLLPILRENPGDPHSRLKCYFLKHAKEADWIRETPPRW
jgi:hypothetical protein